MNNNKTKEIIGPLVFLDGLRGLAAFYVMVGHARWLLWEGYSNGYRLHPDAYNSFEKILVYFFACFRYGNEAVLFFFVLSGFVIHLRYSLALKTDNQTCKFDWIPFMKKRARRLYPPLLLCMLITLIADMLGPQLSPQILTEIPYYLKQPELMEPSHTIQTGLGNMLFLMNSYVPVWGTNGPLWSLKYEWWFYMTYPIFWLISKRSIMLVSMVMLGLYVLARQVDLGVFNLVSDVLSIMLVWWLGVTLADIYTKRIPFNIHWISIFVVLLPVLIMRQASFWTPVLWESFFLAW